MSHTDYFTKDWHRHYTIDLGGALLILESLQTPILLVKHTQKKCELGNLTNTNEVYAGVSVAKTFLQKQNVVFNEEELLPSIISLSEIKSVKEPVSKETLYSPFVFCGKNCFDLGSSILFRDNQDNIFIISAKGEKELILNLNELGNDLSVLAKKTLDICNYNMATFERFINKLADWLN